MTGETGLRSDGDAIPAAASVSPDGGGADAAQDVLDTSAAGGLIVRGGALRFLGYVAIVGLSVVSAALLTRYLGVNGFGQYTTVISLVTIVAAVTDAGMSSIGTREYSVLQGRLREELMRDLLGLRVTLTIIGSVFATAFALAAGWDPALVAGTVAASLAIVALVLQHTLAIPLTTALRLGVLSGLDVARQALTVALLVLAIILDGGVFWLLAVTLIVNLVLIVPTARMVRGTISLRLSIRPRKWAELLRLTVYFSLAAAASTIYLYIAQILTSLVASHYQSGLFSAAFRVFIVIAAVPGMLVSGALPMLARAARDDRARLRYALQRTFDVSLIVGTAAVLGVVSGARLIIAVVAGPKFAEAVGVLQIEGVALLASFVLAGWGFGLLALQRHRAMLLANLMALAVSAGLTAALASVHGASGAAVASICGEATVAIIYLIALIRYRPDYRPEIGVVVKVALAAVPATVAALVPNLSRVVQPIVTLAVFAILILALRAIPDEVLDLLPERLRLGRRES